MESSIEFEDLKIVLPELRVWFRNAEIYPSLRELRLLLVFLSDPHRTMSTKELIDRTDVMSLQALYTLIARVRVLLDQQYIFTVRGGIGYSFMEPTRVSD